MGPPPRVKQLEIILYWQKLQDKNRRSVKAIKPRKLGPAQTTYFLFSKPAWQHVRMCTGRLFGGQRGIWSKDVPPRCLFRRISWLRDVRTHMGRSWDMPNMDYEPGKSRWLSKGNGKKYPIKVTQTTKREWLRDSFPESAFASIHTYCTLFPLNKYLFHYILSLWEFFSAKLKARALVTDHSSSV